jgi:arylsulfatase A-like enzyme
VHTNVVVVTIDALRADRVGALGGRDLTPTIDTFSQDAATFTNAHSVINTTDPAVTSIQTGRYPLSHGVLNHGWRVTDQEKRSVETVPQLPEVLSDAGYRTAKFGRPLGRWHRNGFDRYPSQMESRIAFDEQKQPLVDKIGELLDNVNPTFKNIGERFYTTVERFLPEQSTNSIKYDHWRDRSEDRVIQNLASWIDGEKPFFSFVHLMDTHGPYTAPPELVKTYLEEFDYEVDKTEYEGWEIPSAFHAEVMRGDHPEIRHKYYFSETPSTAVINASYDASVTVADTRLKYILNVLSEQGVAEDTIIIVLADHGESLTEHGIYYDHHGLYEATTRVPLFIKLPNGSSSIINDLVQITDVAPTVTAALDIDGLDPDGHSLLETITEGVTLDREFILAEEAHTQRRQMIRTKSHKLIRLVDGDTVCRYCDIEHAPSIELYDLNTDPAECDNLGKSNMTKVSELQQCSMSATEQFESRRPAENTDTNSKVEYEDEQEVFDRLEALGYK